MSKIVSFALQRRIRQRSKNQKKQPPFNGLDAALKSIIAITALFIAYAQWKTSERQTNISDSLAKLEFAKNSPNFDISISKEYIKVSPDNKDNIILPKYFSVKSISGVRSMGNIDIPVSAMIMDSNNNYLCSIEIRGLYLDIGRGNVEIFDKSLQDLRILLTEMHHNDLVVYDLLPDPLIRYNDLFGKYTTNKGSIIEAAFPKDTAILYSGTWSGGSGFYFDEGEPERSCPEGARALKKALAEIGGGPGPIP